MSVHKLLLSWKWLQFGLFAVCPPSPARVSHWALLRWSNGKLNDTVNWSWTVAITEINEGCMRAGLELLFCSNGWLIEVQRKPTRCVISFVNDVWLNSCEINKAGSLSYNTTLSIIAVDSIIGVQFNPFILVIHNIWTYPYSPTFTGLILACVVPPIISSFLCFIVYNIFNRSFSSDNIFYIISILKLQFLLKKWQKSVTEQVHTTSVFKTVDLTLICNGKLMGPILQECQFEVICLCVVHVCKQKEDPAIVWCGLYAVS